VRTERAEPVLPARDLDETRAFYERLGFKPWFGPNAPWTYEIVSRGELVLHFFAERDLNVRENCAGCYLRVKDADALHRECAAMNLPGDGTARLSELEDQAWGMREFVLVDPSGNQLRIGHDLDE
jgi:catechol 2,3-dioxygenase-like lactoylglutathione lyase family enzyme